MYDFDRDFEAKFTDLDSIFYDSDQKFDWDGRNFEALHETRCIYYYSEEEIKNDEVFKERFKKIFTEIKEYSEEEAWNPNTGKRYIYDEDDFYNEYYDEIWGIEEGFDLHYQRYLQEK